MPAKVRLTPIECVAAALRTDDRSVVGLERLARGAADLDEVVVAALALGLAPLLQYRLKAAGYVLPEPRAQAKLDFMRQAEIDRQTAIQAQLAELLAALPATPIVLKGAYLAEKAYPEPGLRPMNDIDLLFRPDDLPAAARVLADLGYGSKVKSELEGPGITKHTSTFQQTGTSRAATPNPYLSAPSSRMVEPHRSLEEAWFGLKCDVTPGMWERSIEATLAGQQARVLDPTDAFLHLTVHLAFHLIQRAPSFVQLADLSICAQHLSVNWDGLLARARELRASGYVYAATRLAQSVLGAAIPPEVIGALAAASPRRVRAVAETLSLEDVMRRTQAAPLRSIRQRLLRGVADRAETARWAHSAHEWRRVWGTLFDVSRTDTWKLLRQQG